MLYTEEGDLERYMIPRTSSIVRQFTRDRRELIESEDFHERQVPAGSPAGARCFFRLAGGPLHDRDAGPDRRDHDGQRNPVGCRIIDNRQQNGRYGSPV